MKLVVLIVVVIFLAGKIGVAAWPLAVIAVLIWYWRDVRRHKRVRCRICTGSGIQESELGGRKWFRKPFGDCWCCGGTRAHPRLAARLLDPRGYREIKEKIAQGKARI